MTRKLILILVIFLWLTFFLWLTLPISGQEKVFLPLILKGRCNMADWAILEISDGGTTVNLLKGNEVGFHLSEWNPAIAQAKGGGVFQNSSLAPFRRLVSREFAVANEVLNLKVNGYGQDRLVEETQDLLRLLEKALAYWLTDWSNVTIDSTLQSAPVWIKARAQCETNARYALIHYYTIPNLDNPYAQPFFNVKKIVAMDDFLLGLERGHWLANQPGSEECVESSSVQNWGYQDSWSAKATPAASFIRSFVQIDSGKIFAGENGNIYESVNDGDNWALNSAVPAGNVNSLLLLENGYLLAGDDGQILRSINSGGSWGVVTAAQTSFVYNMIQLTSGRILATDFGQIFKSDDNGTTWSVATTQPYSSVRSLLQLNSGRILAGEFGYMWVSDDNGDSWSLISSWLPNDPIYSLLELPDGSILGGSLGDIKRSIDNGETWIIVFSTSVGVNEVQDLLLMNNGSIIANETSQILRSDNNGLDWFVTTTAPAGVANGLVQTQAESVLSGDFTDVNKYVDSSNVDIGREATCNNEIFIANKQNIANFTHIKIDDGGVFTDIFPISSFPQALLPAIPAIGDAVYFIIDTSLVGSGPFAGTVFDIDTPANSTTSYTLTPEYYNGAWVALTIRDNTEGPQGILGRAGVSAILFQQPSDWTTLAVDGVTGYMIRLRLSALVGTLTPPTQQNRDIYSIVLPYTEVSATQVLGDIAAVARIKIQNQSDEDGRGGSSPDLWSNRLLVGLRSFNRGESFQAYLNAADEQNPTGVTVSLGTNVSFITDVSAPTGRIAQYNPAGVEAMADRVTFELGPTIARDFNGIFHPFLRVQRTAGASTDFDIQLQIVTGSGGISFTTPSRQVQGTTAWELLDFGRVTIPAAGVLQLQDLGDITEIRVQASAASGTPNLNIYDLILLPVDEWSIDAVDFANNANSIIGRNDDLQKLLDIDSVTNPKVGINSIVRVAGSDLVTSIYDAISSGEAILQANAQQRLWFLSARTSATGTSYNWLSEPWVAHSIQLTHNARYLGYRGNR